MHYFTPQYQTTLLTPSSNEYGTDFTMSGESRMLSNKQSLTSLNSANSDNTLISQQSVKSIKRRRSSSSSTNKFKRNDTVDNQDNTEWPTYNHPQGGLVQFTPWGNIRKTVVNGVEITKFEDGDQDLQQYIPDSPVSMINSGIGNNSTNSNPINQNLNSDGEVESYLIEGYTKEFNQDGLNEQFYQHEHENYFGMDSNQDQDIDNDQEMN